MDVLERSSKFKVRRGKTAKPHRAVVRSMAACSLMWMVVGAGCAELRPALGPKTESVEPKTQASAHVSPIPAAAGADTEEQSTLAAVEEFLDRTKQFRPGATKPTDVTPPSPEDVAAASANKENARNKPSPDQTFANTNVSLTDNPAPRPAQAIPAVESVSIRTPDTAKLREPNRVVNHATNTSLDAHEDDLYAAAERLLKALETDAGRKHDFESEWRWRLAQLALDRQSSPPTVSTELAEPTRALLLAFLEAAAGIESVGRDPQSAAQAALDAVEELRDQLAERSDPTIRAVKLCRKVVTYGVYEEMTADDFVAGRSLQTIVYTELRNLHSRKTDDGVFETKLATRLELYSAKGDSVWQRDEPEVTDRCREKRSDFFLAQRITLPPTLPAGDYTLKVSIEDRVASRADERTVGLAIVSPVSVASKKALKAP